METVLSYRKNVRYGNRTYDAGIILLIHKSLYDQKGLWHWFTTT
jgi:hypothetical protein